MQRQEQALLERPTAKVKATAKARSGLEGCSWKWTGKGSGKNEKRGNYLATKFPSNCCIYGKYGHKVVICWQRQVASVDATAA